MSLLRILSKSLEAAARPARGLLTAGLDFLAPPACPLCGGADFYTTSQLESPLDPLLCPACVKDVAKPGRDACRRCAAPVGPHLETSDGCMHCRTDRFAFAAAVAIGRYDGRLQLACRKAKQPEGAPLASALTDLLWSRSWQVMKEWQADIVVPVPRFWIGRLLFGHTAATVAAETLARRLNIPCGTDALSKVRWTPSQTSLPATERRHNLRDAFSANSGRLKGRRVLLVDDVLTTGTTAHRCARTMRKAGADAVTVAVLARGLGRPDVAST